MPKLFHLETEKAVESMEGGQIAVGVFGLGYVGLPLAIAWGLAGAKLVGVTKNVEHLRLLKEGKVPFPEEAELQPHLRKLVSSGRFDVFDDNRKVAASSDVKLIAVPIPVGNSGVDFSSLADVCDTIGSELRAGDLIILESSAPPMTTRDFVRPLLEKRSGMRSGRDFGLAYSPERIYIGRALKDLQENYPKVVGADDDRSRLLVSRLYSTISKKGVIEFNSTVEAETEKLFEGVYRDVNIALANELGTLAEKMGVSYSKMRDAANSQPFCHLHLPGIGVGGYCIPMYPLYLIGVAEKIDVELSVVKVGRKTNQKRPLQVARTIIDSMKAIGIDTKGSEVFVMGLAFREDVGDIRKAPSLELIRELRKHVRGIRVYDPLVKVKPRIAGARIVGDVTEGIPGARALVVAVAHSSFKNYKLGEITSKMESPFVVFDTPGIFRDQVMSLNEAGTYIVLGEPPVGLKGRVRG